MRAIISRQREDGTYADVGMNDRTLTGSYKTINNIIRYGIPNHYKGRQVRLELFHDGSINSPANEAPFKILFIQA